ncbi:MAG: transposase [Bdellovibrionota bacterium]
MKQLKLLKNQKSAYGGELMKTRKGRQGSRPLATRESMHLVLRSSKATKEWSFTRPKHAAKIKELSSKFAAKYGVKIYSVANVGNHLHFHLKLSNRFTYKPFIRALTSVIAMAVTGTSRWKRPVKAARAVTGINGSSMTKAQPKAAAKPELKGQRLMLNPPRRFLLKDRN